MSNMFDDDFTPSEEACKLADDISTFLVPIYQKWVTNHNLSPRQISYIVNDVNKLVESQFLLSKIDLNNLTIS